MGNAEHLRSNEPTQCSYRTCHALLRLRAGRESGGESPAATDGTRSASKRAVGHPRQTASKKIKPHPVGWGFFVIFWTYLITWNSLV